MISNARNKSRKTIAVVLYPGMTALDLVGTLETLMPLNLRSPYRTVTVGERIEPVQTDTPLKLIPNQTFAEVPEPSVLIVPGGPSTAVIPSSEELFRYVRSASKAAEVVASIGTGSVILGTAGLLDGRCATTHWARAEQLAELGVRFVRQRWVEDGKFLTAAGSTAGIDMALYLVAKLTSESKARSSQLIIEYDPQPPFGGIDWDGVGSEMAEATATRSLSSEFGSRRDDMATSVMAKERG